MTTTGTPNRITDWRGADLFAMGKHARDLGVEIIFADLPGALTGLYDKETATIFLDESLDVKELLLALAHELIHAERGHDSTVSDEEHLDVELEAQRRLGYTSTRWTGFHNTTAVAVA